MTDTQVQVDENVDLSKEEADALIAELAYRLAFDKLDAALLAAYHVWRRDLHARKEDIPFEKWISNRVNSFETMVLNCLDIPRKYTLGADIIERWFGIQGLQQQHRGFAEYLIGINAKRGTALSNLKTRCKDLNVNPDQGRMRTAKFTEYFCNAS